LAINVHEIQAWAASVGVCSVPAVFVSCDACLRCVYTRNASGARAERSILQQHIAVYICNASSAYMRQGRLWQQRCRSVYAGVGQQGFTKGSNEVTSQHVDHTLL